MPALFFKLDPSIKERLEKKSIQDTITGCIEWQGARSQAGYGEIKIQGKKYNTHRVAYRVYNGEFDYSLWVLHKCDNPCCLNIDHLFLGTRSDNMLDCSSKKRLYIQNIRSVDKPMSKLSESDVKFIRKYHKSYDLKYGSSALSRKFGVSRECIDDVVRFIRYKDIA